MEIMIPEQIYFCISTAEKIIGNEFTPKFHQLCEMFNEIGVFPLFWETLASTIIEEPDQTKWGQIVARRLREELA